MAQRDDALVAAAEIVLTVRDIARQNPPGVGTVGFVDNLDFDSDYTYWNAGLTLAYGKFSFDFRYWDTDSDGETLYGDLADERFVFTAKVVLP
jgi:hypothetical protein